MSELSLKCPADFNHNCPGDWDDDYKSIWVQLQVQKHNKMQYRKAWKEAQSELTAARDEAERLRGRLSELEGAVDMFIEQAEFKRQCCGSMGQLRRPYEHAKRLRQQADSLDKGE